MLCVTDDDSHYRRQLTRNHERIPVAEHFCMVSSNQTSLYYNTGEAATELDCKIRPARKKTCRSFVNQYIRLVLEGSKRTLAASAPPVLPR